VEEFFHFHPYIGWWKVEIPPDFPLIFHLWKNGGNFGVNTIAGGSLILGGGIWRIIFHWWKKWIFHHWWKLVEARATVWLCETSTRNVLRG
jgi:hypothetical protein